MAAGTVPVSLSVTAAQRKPGSCKEGKNPKQNKIEKELPYGGEGLGQRERKKQFV